MGIQRRMPASAESAKRIVDDHLPRERLHHFGFEKGQLSMLAWQAHRNAQTEAIFAPAQGGSSTAARPRTQRLALPYPLIV